MNRKILLILIIFLILPIAHPALTFEVEETQKVSVALNASDPDQDSLIWTYSEPLDSSGEWQTTYGDVGQYKATVEVSDGQNSDSKEVTIIVKKKEEKPIIESFIPSSDEIMIGETEPLDFRILATDINKDELSYTWFVDGKKLQSGPEFTYSSDYNGAGTHEIIAEVSDGSLRTSRKWAVNVNDVDVKNILDSILDVEINEDETASVELPDFENYGLTFTISDPVGNDNQWKTTFKDEGTYKVKIHAEGKGFSGDKTIRLTVNNVDIPVDFKGIESVTANEGDEITLDLRASDPDNDEISFSAKGMPKGSSIDGDTFKWTPDHDIIKKGGFGSWLFSWLSGTSKTYYIKFIAESNGIEVVQNAIITIKDSNRAPVIEDMGPLKIKEGQKLSLSPKVYDLDGDKVSLKYFGLSDKSTFMSGFDDAGIYKVNLVASDGKLQTSKDIEVIIEDSNRAPTFNMIKDANVPEGETLVLILSATDPDGDEIEYSIDNPPEGSYIKGNAFFWTPNYSTVISGTKNVDLVFTAKDKSSESRDIVKVQVENKNRLPTITSVSKSINAKVNKPVLMSAAASDEDGDPLTYTWDFNMLEKYEAQSMQRVFTSRGIKQAKLIVSDGIDKVEELVNINVG